MRAPWKLLVPLLQIRVLGLVMVLVFAVHPAQTCTQNIHGHTRWPGMAQETRNNSKARKIMEWFVKWMYGLIRLVPRIIAKRSYEGDADKGGVHPELHPLGILLWSAMAGHVARLLAWGQAWKCLHHSATCLHDCGQRSQGKEQCPAAW